MAQDNHIISGTGSTASEATEATVAPVARHVTERVRHELKRRRLQVVDVRRTAPRMVRITLGGDELEGFKSLGYDDHVKVIFESPGVAASADAPAMRDYTPRHFDPLTRRLEIDFVLHGEGPASTWAAQAAVGQSLTIGGPRGSFIVPTDFDAYVLVGDESAWPAITRRLEELPPGAKAFVIAEVDSKDDEQTWTSRADVQLKWVHRRGAEQGRVDLLSRAVEELRLPEGDCYYWSAGESAAMRHLRPYFMARGAPKEWIKAAGYWKHGEVASHETIGN